MMQHFLIETFNVVDKSSTVHMVEAKTFSEAVEKLHKLHGDGDRKLVGVFEKSEIDKKVMNRVK